MILIIHLIDTKTCITVHIINELVPVLYVSLSVSVIRSLLHNRWPY